MEKKVIIPHQKNKRYAIDFDKFFERVTKRNTNEKYTDSTITEIWQPDTNDNPKLMNKEMIENKYDMTNPLCAIRYEFLNELMTQITSLYSTPLGDIVKSEKQLSFGQRIIFESFIKEGIIYEIND